MLQLQILSGKLAGHEMVVRHFPFFIGRAAECDLRLDDPGVWARHLRIGFKQGEGFEFSTEDSALTLVNGTQVEGGILRNGDLLQVGAVELRFWLARSEQKTLWCREALTWASLFSLLAVQLGLIYWLLR